MPVEKSEYVPRRELEAVLSGIIKQDVADLAALVERNHGEVISRLDRLNGKVDIHDRWIERREAGETMADATRQSIRNWMVIAISVLVAINGVGATMVTILTR